MSLQTHSKPGTLIILTVSLVSCFRQPDLSNIKCTNKGCPPGLVCTTAGGGRCVHPSDSGLSADVSASAAIDAVVAGSDTGQAEARPFDGPVTDTMDVAGETSWARGDTDGIVDSDAVGSGGAVGSDGPIGDSSTDAPLLSGGGGTPQGGSAGTGGLTGSGGSRANPDGNGEAARDGATDVSIGPGGGTSSGGISAGGVTGTGGYGSGGANATGGAATGGSVGTGGSGTGGSVSSGGTMAGTGGVVGTGGTAGRGSPGCGIANPMQSGAFEETINGTVRQYLLDVPATYDKTQPYRLVFVWHSLGSTASAVASSQYNGLRPLANDTAIFVAPSGLTGSNSDMSGTGWWNVDNGDMTFLQAMLDRINNNLCVDKDRVFSTGFDFGGRMTYTVGYESNAFRAIAPCSGDLRTIPHQETYTDPLAVIGFHGSNDNFVLLAYGRSARDSYVARNKCGTQTQPVSPSPCVQYQGCVAPTTWCEFSGAHVQWAQEPATIWAFFSQF